MGDLEKIKLAREEVRITQELQQTNRVNYINHRKSCSEPQTCVVCDLFHKAGYELISLVENEHSTLKKLRGGYNA